MSYSSRVYRHRNAHTPENENDSEQSSFFKKNDKQSAAGKTGKPFFQAKLNVNEPGDKYEKEADNVANNVANKVANKTGDKPAVKEEEVTGVQRLATAPVEEKISTDEERMKRDKDVQTKPEIQRKCAECEGEEKEKEKEPAVQKKDMPGVEKEKDKDADKKKKELEKDVAVQKKASNTNTSSGTNSGAAAGNTTSPKLSSRIQSAAGKGKKMPGKTLSEMQSGFGADFNSVRIHTDAESVDMNKRLDAQAFTHGNDIYFNSGKFNPESTAGKLLLAHELTHVLQQRGTENIETPGVQKAGAATVAAAALSAVVICSLPFYFYAMANYSHKGDKWMHCWVSCKITAYCGGHGVATLMGAGKEAMDAVFDALGMGYGAEFADFVADMKGTFDCTFHTCAGCCDDYYPKK